MNVGSLFSGCGLFDLGLALAGLQHRWFCEVDAVRRQFLARRWPGVRIYDDVRAVGADAERPTVIAGGFPCKGASTVGKREGFGHPETRLWREMGRAIGEIRPRYVVIENVANLLALNGGALWGEVLGDLAAIRYDVQWDCIPAAAFGAPHLRDRVVAIAADSDRPSERWLASLEGRTQGWPHLGRGDLSTIAHAHRDGVREQPESKQRRSGEGIITAADEAAADSPRDAEGGSGEASGAERQRARIRAGVAVEWGQYEPAIRRWEAVHGPAPEPLVRRVDDGRTSWMDRSRLSALGDGVHVQLGVLVGRCLVRLEEGQLAA